MKTPSPAARGWLALLTPLALLPLRSQEIRTAVDPAEPLGDRPYEMVWANRQEPASPTLRFDRLDGWRLQLDGAAQASLHLTRAQNVWDRPVARLRYRGDGKAESKPRIRLLWPTPLDVAADADAVEAWIYGNRWSWENPPGTPPVRLILRLLDGDRQPHELPLDQVRWQEWWLVHKRLPSGLKPPLRLEALEVADGWQTEWRELFFDSIRFYPEQTVPLEFASRPERNLRLWPGQDPGANTGPGRLPFPTREQTILPLHLGGKFRTSTRVTRGTAAYAFRYQGTDGEIEYWVDGAEGLGEVRAWFNGQPVWELKGARLLLPETPSPCSLDFSRVRFAQGVLTMPYSDGTELQFRLWQKSLVVDVIHRSGAATGVDFGQFENLEEPRLVIVPYLNYGGGAHPCVLLSRTGTNHLFTSLWVDWYRSNGSEPYAAESVTNGVARINGGVRYHPRTDRRRNRLFERLFLTVSPAFEEVLPTVPNPTGLHAREATGRLWQESWGPDNYTNQMQRSRTLRAYGIDQLIQCNHEITWRDGGESFTLRTRAAPRRGGDRVLAEYVTHQRSLGWLSGLYSNYTDYAPVNEHWTPDAVQRQSDGAWRTAWPRCYALKPLKAVEFDARLAPQIKAKFDPNSAYTDVHTAVAPWQYNDYDGRVPGAATFAQTFYAYGELLRNDSRVYRGPIFSEGTYHWLYAGLADGNYALAYDGRPLANEPLLPVFDLYQIHSRECDIGMGWTANFCDAIPDWRKPENLDRAIDRFLLHTLAYGHIGWLVEEEHGFARTCRSYYMLQQVQARYGLQAPARIAYWDGVRLVSVSEALVRDLPRTRRQLYVAYPSGLRLWLNDHPTENWTLPAGGESPGRSSAAPARGRGPVLPPDLVLPPAGWAAVTPGGELMSYSALRGGQRVDCLRSAAYLYQDGRGRWFDTPAAGSNGALAIRPLPSNELEVIRISGEGPFTIRRPYQTRGFLRDIAAFDTGGQRLPTPTAQDADNATRIEPVPGAVRYRVRFDLRAPRGGG